MPDVRWKHSYAFTYSNGRVKVTCRPCGTSSRWFNQITEDDLLKKWCNDHPGLRLRGEGRASSS